MEPKIRANQAGFVAGVTDVPNRGPRTVGFSPAQDVVMCWEVGSGPDHCGRSFRADGRLQHCLDAASNQHVVLPTEHRGLLAGLCF